MTASPDKRHNGEDAPARRRGRPPAASSRELIDAIWQDHVRLGIELQENIMQVLAGMKMLAGSLHSRLAAQQSAQAMQAAALLATAEQAHSQMRDLRRQLVPVEADGTGLMLALSHLAEQIGPLSGVRCVFQCRGEVTVEDHMLATQLFRIAEDAVDLAIAAREAGNVTISLSASRGPLVLAVSDDGEETKVSPEKVDEQLVLRIMQYRARAIGARLENRSRRQGGRTLRCSLRR